MKKSAVYSKSEACVAEGWEIEGNNVWAYNKSFPLVDPIAIHLKTYRTDESHQTRYDAMKRAFEIFWPKQILTWNYWMERIFWEHTDHDTDIFSIAGGGGIGKTQSMAYAGSIFWLALPHKRTVLVTSTTLESLKARIYGYILRALNDIQIDIPFGIKNTPPPSINPVPPDFIHGIYGIAAKQGSEEETIKNIIGRHPEDSLLMILDEAPDMPVAIMNAIPNLKKGLKGRFQCTAIGNPNDPDDLHGALSTPKVGWENIDPTKDFRWPTTQPKGFCLYFNPYDSPAIHETDPKKKAALSHFLMTEEKLIQAEREEGTDSDAFWRFTMGFWRTRSTRPVVVSEEFLKDYDPTQTAEFSGLHDLHFCAGLDPAFTTGGDKCILRLAILGHHVNGKMILDYKQNQLLFPIKIKAKAGFSAERQIAQQVLKILLSHKVSLRTLCIDASGQGRGIADVIQLESQTPEFAKYYVGHETPTKIFSTNIGQKKQNTFDAIITSAYDLWFTGRTFINNMQIFGLDTLAYAQLHHRRFIEKNGKKTLESKVDYKRRMTTVSSVLGRSPDEADAAMLTLQSAILHYGFFPGQQKEIVRYADEQSRKFAIALANYKEQMEKQVNPSIIRGKYNRGIGSLLKKKAF